MKRHISRYLSYILRHHPESIGVSMDEHGYVHVDELLEKIQNKHPLTFAQLKHIVDTNDKQRFSFNDDYTLIRANQGHSINVDVELEKIDPPEYLYHGTGQKYEDSIDKQGLIKKNRLYVHLSKDIETARNVGIRHGQPVIYLIECKKMKEDGFVFYLSKNKVYLVDHVPVKYLKKLSDN